LLLYRSRALPNRLYLRLRYRLFRESIDLGKRKPMRFVLLAHLVEAGTLILLRYARSDIRLRVMARMILAVLHQRPIIEA